MLAKTIKRAVLGFVIGAAVGYVISILTGLDRPDELISVSGKLISIAGGRPAALILQGLFSGIYGAICFGCMSFYDIESWPLALATGAHCASIILPFIPLSLFLGWAGDAKTILIMAGIQLAAFFMIWLILYFTYKKQVKVLNEKQELFLNNYKNDQTKGENEDETE